MNAIYQEGRASDLASSSIASTKYIYGMDCTVPMCSVTYIRTHMPVTSAEPLRLCNPKQIQLSQKGQRSSPARMQAPPLHGSRSLTFCISASYASKTLWWCAKTSTLASGRSRRSDRNDRPPWICRQTYLVVRHPHVCVCG